MNSPLSKTKDKLRDSVRKNCTLYGENIGDFRLLDKDQIFSKKILTLDLDNLGLPRNKKDIETKLAKHTYDLMHLYWLLDKTEFQVLRHNIFEQIENEIYHQKKSKIYTPEECVKNLSGVLDSLGFIDSSTQSEDSLFFKTGFKNVKTFLPTNVRENMTIQEWGAFGWCLENLINCCYEDKKNNQTTRISSHYETREDLSGKDEELKEFKSEIIKDLLEHKIQKPFKHRSILSLRFKQQLLEVK